MHELSDEQIKEVSGGIIPIAMLAFVYYERENIRDFIGGVLDGFNDTSHMAP